MTALISLARIVRSRGGVLGLMFAGYVPLASQSPYPIMLILVTFWEM